MDVITYALAKKMGGGGESITYTLTADTENKTIVLTPSKGTAQVITVPYATDASTVNGHEVPELENGKIPANFLPSFVDNVDEYDNISLFPVVGESNRIYIDKSTNKTYRWSGTAYVEISESIALGETSSTAYRGDRGKIAYDHSQSAHAPSNAEANQNAFSNVKIDSDIINAGTTTDTLEFIAGDNIILTPNVSNKKITVSQVPVRKTASGDIASFSDGTGDPFLEVKASIEPQQDLHGYDNPWVGGAGKNLLKNEYDGTTFASVGDDGSITLNGTVSGLDWLHINDNVTLKAGTYTLSGTPLNAPQGLYIYDDESFGFEGIWADFEGRGVTRTILEDKTGKIFLRVPAGTYNNLKIYPMLESGSSKTSFAPYENICPISGHTEANVTRTGKNLFDYNNIDNIKVGSIYRNGVMYDKAGTYTVSAQNSGGFMYVRTFNTDGTVKDTYNVVSSSTITNATFIIGQGEKFAVYDAVETTIETSKYWFGIWQVQVELSNQATTYSPYQGSTLSIPFHDDNDNPITVYGGRLNVTSGELRVDRAIVDLGTLTWTYNASQFFQRFYSAELQATVKKPASDDTVASAMCSNYPLVSATTIYSGRDKVVSIGANGTLSVADSAYTDATAFKTAMSGVQLVYELATPQTYQLTPTQVATLLGQNNIFADCGQIEVAYKTPFYTDLTTKNEVQALINESITSALNASY